MELAEFVAKHGGPVVDFGGKTLCADGATCWDFGLGFGTHVPSGTEQLHLKLQYARIRLRQVDSAWRAFEPPPVVANAVSYHVGNQQWNEKELGPPPPADAHGKYYWSDVRERLCALGTERKRVVAELTEELGRIAPHLL